MHNSPNRGVCYHIFENKDNYLVIPIYASDEDTEVDPTPYV